jgi:hypothetical protein
MTHTNIDTFLQKWRWRKTNSKIFMDQLYTLNKTPKYILTSVLKAHRKYIYIYIYLWLTYNNQCIFNNFTHNTKLSTCWQIITYWNTIQFYTYITCQFIVKLKISLFFKYVYLGQLIDSVCKCRQGSTW